MARENKTITPVQPESLEATFKPFTWNDPGKTNPLPADHVLEVIGTIRDLANGAVLVMQLAEASQLKVSAGEAPMFSPTDRGALERLAIRSMQIVADEAEALDFWALTNHGKKGGTR